MNIFLQFANYCQQFQFKLNQMNLFSWMQSGCPLAWWEVDIFELCKNSNIVERYWRNTTAATTLFPTSNSQSEYASLAQHTLTTHFYFNIKLRHSNRTIENYCVSISRNTIIYIWSLIHLFDRKRPWLNIIQPIMHIALFMIMMNE